MLRRYFIILIFSCLLMNKAFALALSDIQVNSALYEPLNAQIELQDLRGVPLFNIQTSLAPLEAFQLRGLDRPFSLTALKFNVERDVSGKPIIHVITQDPINDPYLIFLLQVDWPQGTVIREYKILLDPKNTNQDSSVIKAKVETEITNAFVNNTNIIDEDLKVSRHLITDSLELMLGMEDVNADELSLGMFGIPYWPADSRNSTDKH